MKASKSEEESEWLWRQRKNLRRLEFKSGEIARGEFDFGPVPDEEVEACCFYEYARESASVIHSVLRWRQSAKNAGNTRHAKLAAYHPSLDDQLKTGTGEDSVVKLAKSDFVTCNTNQAIGGQPLASANDPSSYNHR